MNEYIDVDGIWTKENFNPTDPSVRQFVSSSVRCFFFLFLKNIEPPLIEFVYPFHVSPSYENVGERKTRMKK